MSHTSGKKEKKKLGHLQLLLAKELGDQANKDELTVQDPATEKTTI